MTDRTKKLQPWEPDEDGHDIRCNFDGRVVVRVYEVADGSAAWTRVPEDQDAEAGEAHFAPSRREACALADADLDCDGFEAPLDSFR